MSKNPGKTPSVSERRRQEELRRQKARQRNLLIGGVALAIVLLALGAIYLNNIDTSTPGVELTGDRPLAQLDPPQRNNFFDAAPPTTIETNRSYEVVIRMVDGEEMRLRLFDDEAPQTVNNFVHLANEGFYDGTTFHRVLEGFMAQGGDPTGTGGGGPGYSFADETDNGLSFDQRGLLAMANSGPNTNGSQFFITFVPTPHLDGGHTIFGELIEGDEVLSNISLRDPATATEPGDMIETVTIFEK
ncbi:MAG: peptidylprolyl isomerase [Chloroflexota bacterium]|jgi:peptidylprolyl isomerase